MKRLFLLFILVLAASSVYAVSSQSTLSVGDFDVNSDNPDYRFIGKGLSRMVAGELRKADTLVIIEREDLNAVIEEQKLGLSGFIDEDTQLEIGKLLAADYIVVGEIFDMAGAILTSVRLVDTTTGEVAWQDELVKSLASYDFISSYFAAGIISYFDITVDRTTEEKITAAMEKNETAILALSAGIDAYDRNDEDEARRSLRQARDADPENETALFFLNKLTANTAKFRIISESYYAVQNPAYLGELKTDQMYLGLVADLPIYSNRGASGRSWMSMGDGWYFDEGDIRAQLGYSWPVKEEKLGMNVQAFFAQVDDHYGDEADVYLRSLGRWYTGGSVGMGLGLGSISIGGTVSVFYESNAGFVGPGAEAVNKASFSADAGALFHTRSGGFTYGLRLGWSNADYEQMVNLAANTIDQYASVPLFWENSFHWEINGGRTFLVAKNINDFYLDDGDMFVRLLPLAEHFFTGWFSLRGGLEGSVSIVDGSANYGFGVLGGVTFRIPRSGWDFDVNLTYRQRPSRISNDYLYNTMPLSIMISKEGLFFGD